MESILLCIQIVLFHLSSYPNTCWSHQISDFKLRMLGFNCSLITQNDQVPGSNFFSGIFIIIIFYCKGKAE